MLRTSNSLILKDIRGPETYIEQEDKITMMETKLRQAYDKANKEVEHIYDHTENLQFKCNTN